MIYDRADEAIRAMNRRNLELFGRLKLMPKDEVNVIRRVRQVYESAAQDARRRYREVAEDAYMQALIEAGVEVYVTRGLAKRYITYDWVDDMLDEANWVTEYVFTNETERKAHRLAEALEAGVDRDLAVDKALRQWTLQAGEYADIAVARARYDAFLEAGVEYVEWKTQKDERVCEECGPLDGEVFELEQAPMCPLHYRCRCTLRPVTA